MKADRLQGLDALRGIAALMVVGHHAGVGGHYYLAVDFFFVLSGFVMARTYEGRFPSPHDFVLRRWRRFFPMMVLGTAFGFAAGLHITSWDLVGLLAVCALLQLPLPGESPFPLNPPAWSITAELFANLVHAIALRRLSVPALLCVSLAALTGMFMLGAGLDKYPLSGTLRVLISYPLGIVLWRINGDAPRALTWLWSAGLLVAAPAILAVLPRGADFLFPFVAVLIMLGGLTHAPVPRLFTFLGAISFPLYAFHAPVLYLSTAKLGSPIPGVVFSLALASLLVMAPALAVKRQQAVSA